ncbi:MAG: Phosphoribosyl-AMP cyclohydrolase [bacterium]|nr:Phosphoribosyl-AMP cyclohydrolase [bacterium]
MSASLTDKVKFDSHGLVPAIVQDWDTGEVLMMGYMNAESLRLTEETGKTHFYSRSRNKLWLKGESSGHVQHVKAIHIDCDADTVLIRATQSVAACHTGYKSCFYRRWRPETQEWVEEGEKVFDPSEVYSQ